jgi:hypothetical protein
MRALFRSTIVVLGALVSACGANSASARPDCSPGQTSLDGTCVSQQIADYVGCIRATGATVASDNSRSLAAAAGAAGVTASTQADVKDRLEKRYATVSDANAQEIIHNCYAKTSTNPVAGKDAASRPETSNERLDCSGDWITDYEAGNGQTSIHSGVTMKQTGSAVTGTYTTVGRIEGTVDGRNLNGTWSNLCGATKCGGRIAFVFSSDGRSFTGRWGFDDETPVWKWTGSRP